MLLTEVMQDYFVDKRSTEQLGKHADPPESRFVNWENVASPERLIKDFAFNSREALLQFVSDVITFEDKLGHHGKITIDSMNVRLEVYTHDIEQVTELDYEYAKYVDDIAMDIEVIYGQL
jgi:pterin-4a-carbinolamine dehydratase